MEEKKRAIPKMTKKKLSEFDQEQSVGWVIDRAIQIEKRVNDIIINFIEPQNREVFISHILNSTIMSYGAKLKVLHRCIGYDKQSNKLYDDLMKIGGIRNAFAHTDFSYVMNISFGENKTTTWANQIITVMNSKGKADSKNPLEYLNDYLKYLKKVEPQLKEIWDKQMEKISKK